MHIYAYSFYRAANAIFGKVGRLASEEMTLQLIKSKCIPVLLYGLVACPLNKSQLSSLDSVMNTFLMELFSIKKVKFSHTRYRALGPELIPVYRQSARW